MIDHSDKRPEKLRSVWPSFKKLLTSCKYLFYFYLLLVIRKIFKIITKVLFWIKLIICLIAHFSVLLGAQRKRWTYCLTCRKWEVAYFTLDFTQNNAKPYIVLQLLVKLLIIFIATKLWKIEPTASPKCSCLYLEIK